jgi:hypothetical protein
MTWDQFAKDHGGTNSTKGASSLRDALQTWAETKSNMEDQ